MSGEVAKYNLTLSLNDDFSSQNPHKKENIVI
jgi:hypothetical protein